ncbi:MAG TPA: iron-containing alcohol dehydrogenase [Syntrophales bacterium]|nr:iron-containing alcohol dehydrogenase [Syntrophales bacterium]HOM06561.1 iron-containing alcohol dehydrogenase [Syntrophales bacterium]HON99656.1 iron-containing alcohol dehydrogenase [Syntrophales bacterium]HPC00673.1 iron-containing alcohol dehydrogenase [Syntrophales bacterium]HPQ06177.1 iron-containing alcohol dehydrogenase [Syntrophales bacterium]
MIKNFTFTGAGKILFGWGICEGLGDCLAELSCRRPLVVMDGALAAQGLKERIADILARRGLKTIFFDGVEPEPPLETADEGAKAALRGKCDAVVGIGGGSAMDTAKAIAVVAAHRAKAAEFLGLNKVPGPGLKTVMVPTTAGTGSEVTFTAVFVRKDLNKKEGMNSPFLYPTVALLDPELTLTLPPFPTATTGIDALCHAIESYTSRNSSPMSELFSLEAVALIGGYIRVAVHDGRNAEARSNMLLASLYAGLGLANAGVTAVHSLSYPLGGRYGIPHGLANTVLLPAVMNFNLPGCLDKFADLAEALGEETEGLSVREAAGRAVEAVEALIEDCGVAMSLEDLDIPEEDFADLAEQALTVTRPLENNPRKIDREAALEIYRAAW